MKTAETTPAVLTQKQYQALLDLFNECNEDFWLISEETKQAFFNRLYGTKQITRPTRG